MDESDYSSIAANTEGCLAADLELLVDRAIHSASIRYIQSQSLHHPRHPYPHANNDKESGEKEQTESGNRLKTTLKKTNTEDEPEQEGIIDVDVDESTPYEDQVHGFQIEQQDFVAAQKGFTPSSLKGIKLHKSEVSWADIGGMEYIYIYIYTTTFINSM